MDEGTKRDVLNHLDIPESKVCVAPLGPTKPEVPAQPVSELQAVRGPYGIPKPHCVLPSPILALQAKAVELGLGEQLQLLEVIPLQDMHSVYRIARMTVIPTLFEGRSGIPVLEAMALGSPLATSRACSIPEVVGDAGLLFDGLDVADMARALKRLWTDESLQKELASRGMARSAARTWDQAARTYSEIYKEARFRWMSDHGGIP